MVQLTNSVIMKLYTKPKSTLKKRKTAIAHHNSRKALADGSAIVAKECRGTNLANGLINFLPGPRFWEFLGPFCGDDTMWLNDCILLFYTDVWLSSLCRLRPVLYHGLAALVYTCVVYRSQGLNKVYHARAKVCPTWGLDTFTLTNYSEYWWVLERGRLMLTLLIDAHDACLRRQHCYSIS